VAMSLFVCGVTIEWRVVLLALRALIASHCTVAQYVRISSVVLCLACAYPHPHQHNALSSCQCTNQSHTVQQAVLRPMLRAHPALHPRALVCVFSDD
jgi:hypothetical protein